MPNLLHSSAPPAVSRWSVPFQTIEEVRQYFSGNSVECLVCGALRQDLAKHIHFSHGMWEAEYRIRFGIPPTYMLAGAAIRDTHKHCASPDPAMKRSEAAALPPPPPAFRFIGKEAIVDRRFRNTREIDEYVADSTILCLICGRRLSSLRDHLRSKHHIAISEYKAEFGIPRRFRLVGIPYPEPAAIRMRPKRVQPMVKSPRAPAAPRRPPDADHLDVPTVRAFCKKAFEDGGRFVRRHSITACTQCGQEVVTGRSNATLGVTCFDCATPSSRRSRLKYWSNKAALMMALARIESPGRPTEIS